jgi:hypothetical protein
MNQPQGHKEIKEAVVIATISALLVGAVNLSLDEVKEWRKRRAQKRADEAVKADAPTATGTGE